MLLCRLGLCLLGESDHVHCSYNFCVLQTDLSPKNHCPRHIGHRMYRGEYYYMQSDAHVTFTRNWDEDIISQQEATRNEMAVMSTYLTDIVGSIDKNGDSLRDTRPIMCNTDYEQGQNNRYLRHGSQPEAEPTIRELMLI